MFFITNIMDIEENKQKYIELISKHRKVEINSKYGELIIQTNEVQMLLMWVIFLRLKYPSESIYNDLEGKTLGNLIWQFQLFIKSKSEIGLLKNLTEYRDSRNALAHKMFTKSRLNENECNLSIELGNLIIEDLELLKKEEIEKWERLFKANKEQKVVSSLLQSEK